MSDALKLVLDFYQQVVVEGDVGRAEEFLAREYRAHTVPAGQDDRAAFTRKFRFVRERIGGVTRTIEHAIAEGELVAIVDRHELGGDPTKEWRAIHIFRVGPAGITDRWGVYDVEGARRHLGALPSELAGWQT